jgi:hypothetical protein
MRKLEICYEIYFVCRAGYCFGRRRRQRLNSGSSASFSIHGFHPAGGGRHSGLRLIVRIPAALRREGWSQPGLPIVPREGLHCAKTPKRGVKAKLREDWQSATRPNETWAMDFVHDQLATWRKLRVLTIIDTFSRFSPALERGLG